MNPEEEEPIEPKDMSIREVKARKNLVIQQLIQDSIFKGAKNALFLEEMDIQSILKHDIDFRRAFRNAMDFYIVGAWDSSIQFLIKCLKMRPRDGPC